MDTRELTQQVRLSHWAGIMRERNESGKSIRSWCKENGIVEKTYYYWQRRLRESACEQFSELQSDRHTGLRVQGFAEVKLKEPPAHALLPGSGQLQIEIGKLRITADTSYPADRLAALCLELSRRC